MMFRNTLSGTDPSALGPTCAEPVAVMLIVCGYPPCVRSRRSKEEL
jgi:hypothetical protein